MPCEYHAFYFALDFNLVERTPFSKHSRQRGGIFREKAKCALHHSSVRITRCTTACNMLESGGRKNNKQQQGVNMKSDEWLKDRVAYLKGLKSRNEQQELLVLLAEKANRNAQDDKKLKP
jgi:hypothetical protein